MAYDFLFFQIGLCKGVGGAPSSPSLVKSQWLSIVMWFLFT